MKPAGERYRRAFLVNLVSSSGAIVTRFAVSLVLARLMAPDEMGLFAMALGLVGTAQVLRDAGVSAYLQHVPDLTAERFRACLGLSLFTAALFAGLMLACAGLVAEHLGQPTLKPILLVLALGLLLTTPSGLRAALAMRDMDAERMALVSRLGSLSYALASVGLCLTGFGVQGLAWAYVIRICVCHIVYALNPPLASRGLPWRPAWIGWIEPLRFGLSASAATLMQTLNEALPNLLLGRLGSPQQVGLLGRAGALTGLFGSLFGPALGFGALPGLAQIHHRGQSLEPVLTRAMSLVTGLAWPLLVLGVWFGRDLLLLLYGAAWLASLPALLPLALVTGLGLMFMHLGIGLSAVGRPTLAALVVGSTLLFRLLLILLFYDGSLASCAWALAGAALLVVPLQVVLATRHLGLAPRSLWRAVRGSLLLAAGCLAGLALTPWAALPAWLAAIACTSHPLRDEVLQLLRLRSTIRK